MEQQKLQNTSRDLSAIWWRQVGFWGITINAVLGFPALLLISFITPDSNLHYVSSAYPAVLATWAAAAGIRQWGKNKNAEQSPEIYSPPGSFEKKYR